MSDHNLLKTILAEGTKNLGLDLGIVSKINDEVYLVHICKNNEMGIVPGDIFELSQTYCSDVIQENRTKYYRDAAKITEMLKHPCYLTTQLRAYIGTPVIVKGNTWGTLNYSSLSPRKLAYSEQEIDFLEYQARDVGKILEDQEAILK